MARLTPTTGYPSKQKRGEPHRCSFPAPQRASKRTEDGFIDREWREGEKAIYEAEVLHRD